MKTIVGCDTETTGLVLPSHSPLKNQPHIIEYCFLVHDNDLNIIKTVESLVKPPVEIPLFISKITGIETWQVKNEKPFLYHAKKIKKIIEGSKLFVAQNATFDYQVLKYEFKRLNMKVKFPKLFCTIEETMYIKGRRLKNSELHKEFFGVEGSGVHRAEQDIIETMKVYRELRKCT